MAGSQTSALGVGCGATGRSDVLLDDLVAVIDVNARRIVMDIVLGFFLGIAFTLIAAWLKFIKDNDQVKLGQ